MIATLFNRFDWQTLQLTRPEVLRMLVAGSEWGFAMSVGIAGMTFWKYAMICPDEIAVTTLLSVIAGIVAIGPLAAYGRR